MARPICAVLCWNRPTFVGFMRDAEDNATAVTSAIAGLKSQYINLASAKATATN